MTIKEKLVLIKRLSGKTQEKLAVDFGVSFPTLNSWILGKSIPRKNAEDKINEVFLRWTGQNLIPQELLTAKKQAILNKRKVHSGILNILNSRKDIYEQFLLSLTYNTNRIEGSTLTEPETAAILFQNTALPNKSLTEHLEVKNHQAALNVVLRALSVQKPIGEELILKIHGVLMNGIFDNAGQYRNHGVRILGVNLPTAKHLKVPALMKDLVKKIASARGEPIALAAHAHSRFEQIHPFSDGNGRVGRLILAAMLIKQDIAPAIIQQEKRRFYILYLNQSQTMNDSSRWEDFLCDGILAGYDILQTDH